MGTARIFPSPCKLQSFPNQNAGDYGVANIDDRTRLSLFPQPGMPPLGGSQPINALSSAGLQVNKAGVTTGVTTGTIAGVRQDFTVIEPTLKVSFDFVDQVRIESNTATAFSGFGDSGSLIVTDAGDAVALVFANSGVDTLASPLSGLFLTLGLEFVLPD